MVNTIYLLSFVETPRKFIIAIINLRGVSTKLNKYKCINYCLTIRLRAREFYEVIVDEGEAQIRYLMEVERE